MNPSKEEQQSKDNLEQLLTEDKNQIAMKWFTN